MELDNKQIAIYIGLLLVCAAYSMVAPFYPQIAERKGVPIWLIGVIFSLNPLFNLITSLVLGKFMNTIGRKNIIVSCFIFVAGSMIFISPIEDCNMNQLIILSSISRILGGIGGGCIFTAGITIFISDYPDKIQTMIGRMEVALGLGIILGPLIGTTLYLLNLLVSMLIVGSIIFIYSLVSWKMLGTFREYEIQEVNINKFLLLTRPVIFI